MIQIGIIPHAQARVTADGQPAAFPGLPWMQTSEGKDLSTRFGIQCVLPAQPSPPTAAGSAPACLFVFAAIDSEYVMRQPGGRQVARQR